MESENDQSAQSGFHGMPSMEEMMEFYHNVIAKTPEILPADAWQKKHALFTRYYQVVEPRILEHHASGIAFMWRAYPYDWHLFQTPIEQLAWMSIRTKGRCPLYPQYPVGPYLLDFGNPHWKVGLELDGKAFHDAERDLKRDTKLAEMGWRIYRITGSEMNKVDPRNEGYIEDESEDERRELVRQWITKTGDGVIEAIRRFHFLPAPVEPDEDTWRFMEWCRQSLREHSLIEWDDLW